jgi:ATP-dependent RNA helicase SUPV3L1/SUV3
MSRGRVIAMLGPTNTGKTHMAVETMLSYPSGIIGLPLRLLAREIYDRLVARAGARRVALITGEERIHPESARYFVCTVEAMPLEREVDFVAIDEVQLAADLERGHVFTDRILHARGREETWLLGAETIRPILRSLLPGIEFRSRPRLSRLTYAGARKLTRLPPRTAIVAFSAEKVYAIAELIRRQKGGAAVVMGALSPRTRNAQVALYQSGDVDYLVATDAIGMGLNMDVEHVAFAGTRKFDGFTFRELTLSELGQIAGRAGRYLNDGTFGVTAEARPFDADTVEALEAHNFPAIRAIQWRNRNLNFSSIERLLASLHASPRREGLMRAPVASDVAALELLSRQEEIRAMADSPEAVRLLWEACQLPDYRNISGTEHAGIVAALFRFLRTRGRIDEDWLARQVARCARFEGDIDALSNRIAHVRTWTFVANRSHWLDDPLHWQEVTRRIEDRLSDALHERLTKRFIDRKTSVLLRRLREKETLMSSVDDEGAVRVEDSYVGRVEGLRFIADGEKGEGAHEKAWNAATRRAVSKELQARAQSLTAAPDTDFSLDEKGRIIWHGAGVGQLVPGPDLLRPGIRLLADEALEGPDREAVRFRLEKFVSRHIGQLLEPLVALRDDEDITGTARGVAYRLVENLGVLPRREVAQEVRELDQDTRARLRRHGVRFGAWHLFIPAMLKPAPTRLRILLWGLQQEGQGRLKAAELPAPPGQGLTSVPRDPDWPEGFATVCGYMECGPRAVRVDMVERLGDMIRERVFWKPRFTGEPRPEGSVEGGGFLVIPDMMSLVGCSGEDFAAILRTMGYRAERRERSQVVAGAPAGQQDETAAKARDGSREEAMAASSAEAEAPAGEKADAGGNTGAPGQQEDAGSAAGTDTAVPAAEAAEAEEVASGDAHGAGEEKASSATAGGEGHSGAGGGAVASVSAAGAGAAQAAEDAATATEADAAADEAADGGVPAEKRVLAGSAAQEEALAEVAAGEAPAEPEFVEVWWPDGTGPFRRRTRAGKGRRASARGDAAPSPAVDARHGKGKSRKKAAPRRPAGESGGRSGRRSARRERPVDADSPFAVLQKLKQQLENKD